MSASLKAPITIRLLDLYRIGPGPSSSHTVGPMRAARGFRLACLERGLVPARLEVELRGSLSATGRGHGTDRAVLAGLCGWEPETLDSDALLALPAALADSPCIDWDGQSVRLTPEDVRFARASELGPGDLPHPNTLVCRAFDGAGGVLHSETWMSVGGGFVRRAGEAEDRTDVGAAPSIPFNTADELVAAAKARGIGLGDVVLANERAWARDPLALDQGLDRVWDAFRRSIARGLRTEGQLPGGLRLRRRAGDLLARVERGEVDAGYAALARAQAYAYAVNEENAAGGLVVTAPTNGAAGIVPATLVEAADRMGLDRARIHRALATAGSIAMVIKTHASLSGAEVGCQGEVGSATAMAAAALCELLGGDPDQVEFAAEIGLEHNLGLTCDPIRGLVQAPCIERNAMGVAKAWSAARLARHSDGRHLVTLDKCIRVMRRTGEDMRTAYKETSEGGLAVAVAMPEC